MNRRISDKRAKTRIARKIGKMRIEIGFIVEAEPRTKVKLTKLLPIESPSAREYSFFLKAASAVESSGSEVPRATKVEPMKLSERFADFAK